MFRILPTVLLLLLAALPLTAQENQRTAFNEGLARFSELIMAGELGNAVDFLRPDAALSNDEIAGLNGQLQALYEGAFTGSDTVRSEALKGGFRQEMLAFWTEKGEYFYVYLLLHTRDGRRVVLSIQYDTDFDKLFRLF